MYKSVKIVFYSILFIMAIDSNKHFLTDEMFTYLTMSILAVLIINAIGVITSKTKLNQIREQVKDPMYKSVQIIVCLFLFLIAINYFKHFIPNKMLVYLPILTLATLIINAIGITITNKKLKS